MNNVASKKKWKSSGQSTASDKLINVLTCIIYTLFALICVYPFYYIFINSISANDLSTDGKVLFIPLGIQFNNYFNVFKLEGLFSSFEVSVGRTVLGTVLTVFASAYLGFMFSQQDMWMRKFWYRFTIITMYFNAGIIPWYLTMKSMGLTNNFLAYILPTVVTPFYIILVKTYVESIPKELQEAAEIDGATLFTFFIKILMPIIKPMLATIAIFAAVAQWNSFQDTLLLVTDQKLYTLQYTLFQYINQANSVMTTLNLQGGQALQSLASKQTPTSVRMTVTIIVVVPIMLIYPFFQRYIEKGIIIGAVKG
jgi:putative aldouronate transport system permease protein